MNLTATALAWHDNGACVLPARENKRPAGNWKDYQSNRPSRKELEHMLTNAEGIGIVCGTVSGGIELLELEGRAVTAGHGPRLAALLADHGLEDLWRRITNGYVEATPSGGVHYLYRVNGTSRGNTKLARDAQGDVLIETRGEGGWVVIAPSAGRTHPTGGAWSRLVGGPDTIPTITSDERDALHAIATMLDATPPRDEPEQPAATGVLAHIDAHTEHPAGKRPGDDFNARATWDDILTPHGWQRAHRLGRGHAWTRPGKHVRDGISATTNQSTDGIDRLYVFSSSTEFEIETPYTKFAAYTLLEHGGDYQAAAKALAKDGYGEPRPRLAIAPEPTQAAAPPAVTQTVTDGTSAKVIELAPPINAATYGPTEDGVARALAHLHADDLRYCPQRGKWLSWTGARWAWDDAGIHREHIKELARQLPEGDGWATFKKRALSASGVRGIAEQAQSIPTLVVDIAQLDARPYELNTPAGIIDLRTGELTDANPAALHTRTTTASPDFNADAPRWHQFLADTFGNDDELIAFVQRLLGVALIGTVLEQVFVIAHGEGANGKSTLFETVRSVLSSANHGYAGLLGAQALLLQKFEGHPTDIAQLAGQRFTITSELPDEQRFNEEKIKKLTGGDTIDARFMRQDTFTFEPSHTLFLLTNYLPAAEATSPAFWRRVIALPFNHVVPVAERDKHLKEKLLTEADAILAWMARGAADYLAHGLEVPETVKAATQAYAAEQDTITGFLEDCCHIQKDLSAPMAAVRAAYEQWCHELGKKPATVHRFGKALKQKHGVSEGPTRSINGRRVKTYQGIGLSIETVTTDEHDGDRGGW